VADSGNKKLSNSADKPVQERLVDAAEELFCEHGFDETTVRDLAAAARCNVAAVNYYFGGKEKLYVEVWRRRLVLMRKARLTSIETVMSASDGKARLEDLLRASANAFVEPVVHPSKTRQFTRLMARELIDPHLPEDVFAKELIQPTMAALGEALIKTCPGLDRSKVVLVILSFIGQLMHMVHIKTWFEEVAQERMELPKLDLAEVVDHVVEFSAAGIRAYAKPNGQPEG